MRTLLLFVLIGFVVLAGCDQLESVGSPLERVSGSAETDGGTKVSRYTVAQLETAFGGNPVAWDTEYEGREIVIAGVVVSVGLVNAELLKQLGLKAGYYGHVGLTADDGKPLPSFSIFGPSGDVFCTFKENRREEFADLRRGHIVEMTGTAIGHSESTLGPTLSDCANVTITGSYVGSLPR